MSGPRCSLASAEQDEPMLGTAPEASAFLLVEVRGGWAPKILESELPDAVRVFLAAAEARHAGLRLQFIRAPRRTSGALAVYLARVGDFVARVEIERLDEVAALDVAGWLATGLHPGATRTSDALTLVCTHGRRDVCCALLGNPLYDALVGASPARPGDVLPTVWQTSHLGGHRFAPVVLSLPDGHCYGRLGVDEAGAFLRAQESQQVHTPSRLRGRTTDPAWVQAASVAYRTETDERAFGAIVGEAAFEALGPTYHVTLPTRAGAVRVEVEPEQRPEALRPVSCGEALSPTQVWRATLAH